MKAPSLGDIDTIKVGQLFNKDSDNKENIINERKINLKIIIYSREAVF
jgi:hypothetical protein